LLPVPAARGSLIGGTIRFLLSHGQMLPVPTAKSLAIQPTSTSPNQLLAKIFLSKVKGLARMVDFRGWPRQGDFVAGVWSTRGFRFYTIPLACGTGKKTRCQCHPWVQGKAYRTRSEARADVFYYIEPGTTGSGAIPLWDISARPSSREGQPLPNIESSTSRVSIKAGALRVLRSLDSASLNVLLGN